MVLSGQQEQVIEIKESIVSDAHRLALLINYQKQLVANLEGQLYQLIKVAHDVDLTQPGWRLDFADGKGTLARVPTSATIVTPFVPDSTDTQEG